MPQDTTPQRLHGYQRLIEISRDLASTLDLDILLDRIIRAAADITGAEAASILLYDDAAQQLFFQVATNMDQPLMRGLIVPLEGSIAGWIVLNRKPMRTSNAKNDKRHYDIGKTASLSTDSLMGVPLISKEKVVGVLEVINKDGDFTDTDEEMLTVLASQAAVAIENTRLFQQSDLIAEFVHELRTPLASLSTATYLLLRPEISSDQSKQILNNIHNETIRLSTLASSFLDLARLESGRVQFHKSTVQAQKLIGECVSIMGSKSDEYRIAVAIECDPEMVIEADQDKLKQVVLNLISNAIKYNRPGGTVTVRARQNGKANIIEIQDTGVGIPEDALPRLFQKFYRVSGTEGKVQGTGLGLSICKQIVQGHGGKIEVHSKYGEGTTFAIHLPRKGTTGQ
jgi:signal transduction histidine kinase